MVPLDAGPVPPRRLRRTTCRSSSATSATTCNVISVCQPTVPVLAAVSLMASRGETDAAADDHDGRPDRRAQVAHRGQQPGDEQEPQLVREQRDLPRAAQLPRRRPPRLPGLPAAHRLRGDEPGPPRRARTTTTSSTWCAATTRAPRSHRQFYDEYNAVLDMPAEYYLDTIKTVFQDFALVNGTWDVDGRAACARRTSRTHRAADDRRRTRRHLGRRPDPRRARPVHRHPEDAPVPLRRRGRGPLRHLLRPALARDGVPAGARLHRALQPAASRRRRAAVRASAKASQRARLRRRAAQVACAVSRLRQTAAAPGRRASNDALPQTQCTRCGYPDCRGYAAGHCAEGDADINRCPPGGAEGIARLAAADRPAGAAAEPRARPRRPAPRWP